MGKSKNENWNPKSLTTIDDLSAELDKIEAAQHAGTLSTHGKWSVGQNLEHCALFIEGSLDGFEMGIPWPMRLIGKLFIKRMLTKPGAQMKPGFNAPTEGNPLMPRDEVSVDEGLAKMKGLVGRLQNGEQMTQDSPFLGKMTHELWVALHLNHCRMHFGFFEYGEQA